MFPNIESDAEVRFLSSLLEWNPNQRLGCKPQAEEFFKRHECFTNSSQENKFDSRN